MTKCDMFPLICVTWLTGSMLAVKRFLFVWHDFFVGVTWVTQIFLTWVTHMSDMTHSYVWHDSLIRVTWLTGSMLAVKRLDLSSDKGKHISDTYETEKSLLEKLKHPNVVKYISSKKVSIHVFLWMSYVTYEWDMSQSWMSNFSRNSNTKTLWSMFRQKSCVRTLEL